ncbi:MAG: hypothetical protein IID54_07185 [Proteobacteria bacterium]|nr:hypothetical protein [Pseudomonadota bacterium]
MNTSATQPTLREDWQRRRALLKQASEPERDFAQMQIRVLDFLLRRYGDSPEAARRAQFPIATDVYFNERAILVYHHVGREIGIGAETAGEAKRRVASVLHRMAEGAMSHPAADSPETATRSLHLRLADPDPHVRVQSIDILAVTGDLEDVGLLLDLLALPESSDELPGERKAIVRAIGMISGTIPRKKHGPYLPNIRHGFSGKGLTGSLDQAPPIIVDAMFVVLALQLLVVHVVVFGPSWVTFAILVTCSITAVIMYCIRRNRRKR